MIVFPQVDQIMDARAKPYPSDINQMLSYLVSYKCPNGVLIYPKGECEDAHIPIEVESELYTIHVKQIDLERLKEEYLKQFALELDSLVSERESLSHLFAGAMETLSNLFFELSNDDHLAIILELKMSL